MRALSIQVQPERSPGIDMQRVTAAFETIAAIGDLVENHAFDSGQVKSACFNYTFGSPRAGELWRRIREDVLLYHFDPTVAIESEDGL